MSDASKCRYCEQPLITEGAGPDTPTAIRVLQHSSDVCTRNLLMELVSMEKRRMKFE